MYNPKRLFFTNAKQLSIFWGLCSVFMLFQLVAYSSQKIGDPGEVVFEIPIGEYAVPELVFHGNGHVGLRVGASDSTYVTFFREDVIWAALQDSLDGWVLKFTDKNRYMLANP